MQLYDKSGSFADPRVYFVVVVVVVVVVIKKNIMQPVGHFRPPPCASFVYFSGKAGHFYPMFSITTAFLKAPVTNSTHLPKSGLFCQKNSHQPSLMARNLKNPVIPQKW